jgi:NADH-quinone oxidoreductase subunit N
MKVMMGDIVPASYLGVMPEIYLGVTSMVLLLFGAYRNPRVNNGMLFLSLMVLGITGWVINYTSGLTAHVVMNGMFITDHFSVFAKYLLLAAAALTLLLSSDWLREDGGRPFECIMLMMFATLGMMFMVSANDLLSLYLALEMSSLSLYVLASFDREHAKSSEAGLKYFVLGALASGMLLFGISLVYGFAGTTSFDGLAKLFAGVHDGVSKGVVVGLVLVIIGFCFKVSAVPFHMWTPDVYEGSPTPVTAFFATAPKLAAFVLLARLLMQPFGALAEQWQQVIVFTSVASMVVGSLAAIMQTNIKRLLAYSSISHAGFMLMGLAAGNAAGIQALFIYLGVYIFMSAGAFGCVLLMRRHGLYVEDIRELSGLSRTNPLGAIILAIFMFAMAGIPPLAGFFGKLYVIWAAVGAHLTWLTVIGVITSVISGFYYIKIVKLMYFDEPAPAFDNDASLPMRAGIAIATAVTLLFFIIPTPLVEQAKAAAEALLK